MVLLIKFENCCADEGLHAYIPLKIVLDLLKLCMGYFLKIALKSNA